MHHPRTHSCNTAAGARPAPDLAASERLVTLFVHTQPQTRRRACQVVFSEAQQPAAVPDHVEKTAEHTRSMSVVSESASRTHTHSRGIMIACYAAPYAIAARHLRHLSMDGWWSCPETPLEALLT